MNDSPSMKTDIRTHPTSQHRLSHTHTHTHTPTSIYPIPAEHPSPIFSPPMLPHHASCSCQVCYGMYIICTLRYVCYVMLHMYIRVDGSAVG